MRLVPDDPLAKLPKMKILKMLCALLALTPTLAAAQTSSEKIAAAIPAVDRIFEQFQKESHAPGLVYGIVADGRLVHVKTFGIQDLSARRPVTPDSLSASHR
jgi:CubicO group peptidase (beta-lactamase class C family)